MSPVGPLRTLLAHPLSRGLDIDAPETTALRAQIIRGKPFLRRLYQEWYRRLAAALPPAAGPADGVLELGSGAGFIKEFIPETITSDLLPLPGVDRVVDARDLPFPAGSLRAILMTNVLHHVPCVEEFLRSAATCVRPGGILGMIEPWPTPWSRFVYRYLHHEPFEPGAAEWTFATSGPLSGANGALPWMVFERDRARLEREFPQWRVESIRRIMPLAFLLAGGVSMRSLLPGWSYPLVRAAEAPFPWLGMFAQITVRRT